MIGFRIAEEWLDFAGTMGLEIRSPLFGTDSIPGTLSYPISFADTPRNRRLLGFPATRGRRVGPVTPVTADCFLGSALWRRGLLKYGSFDYEKSTYQYTFEADADALATRIDGVTLPAVALGELTVQREADGGDYVLFPVRNPAFFDGKNAQYVQVVNYYNAVFAAESRTVFTPFVKVVALLERVFGAFGYTVGGSWIDDPEIRTLVLYSTRGVDGVTAGTTVPVAELVPEVAVADLLIALQGVFCLGYLFDPVRKRVDVRPLRDVVRTSGYRDRQARAAFRDVANELDGFTLGYTNDGGDEQLQNFVWPEVRLGNGKEEVRPGADTLRMVREADPVDGRGWLLPAAEQKGYSTRNDYELRDNRLTHLRFLFYRGMQPDGQGQLYPLGSSGTENYAGQRVGNYSLSWDGADGLYETWHKDWLAFRANARQEERAVPLTLAEFLLLDPTEKDMVLGLKFLWERISVTVGGDTTISDAKITYHQC